MRIALLADIHGNFPALKTVLATPEFRAADRAFCLGDVVGYYSFPNECATLLQVHRIQTILGNHDAAFLADKPCRDNAVGRASQQLMRELVSPATRDFLVSLPDHLELELAGVRVLLVHGSPSNRLNEYVNPDDPVEMPPGVGLLAMGHTHRAFVRKTGDALMLNPGSVGQPRDGQSGACFATVDLETKVALLHRISYDQSVVR